MNVIERFESKVFIALDGCWIWTAAVNKDGYGQFRYNGSMKLAHRVSYEIYNGDLSADLCLDHLCRKRSCVNPAHLEQVTHAENMRRGLVTKKLCQHGSGFSRCDKGCGFKYQQTWRENNKEQKALYMANYYQTKVKGN